MRMIDAKCCSSSLKFIFISHPRAIHLGTSSLASQKLDHYKVLGVDQKATQTEIKNAYYKKCKLLHPDSGANNISAGEREKMHRLFVELKEAYDILRRPADRRIYDEKLSGQYMRYGPQNQRSSASHRRYYYHGYGPPPQYEGQGRDWRMFWENATGYKAEHMTAEEIRLRNQRQWSTIMRYTLIGLGIVLVYNIGYLMLVFRHDRRLDSLVAKDEIAKSFLRQREFAHQRDDPKHEQEYGQLLKADIDEAHRRKMETLKDKNPNEIREVYRWMNAVRFADPSKRFRLKRRAVIDEEQREEQQRRDALANGQTLSKQSTSSIESERSRQSRTDDLNTDENIKTPPSFRPTSF